MKNLQLHKKYKIYLNVKLDNAMNVKGEVLEVNDDCVILKTCSLTFTEMTLYISHSSIAAFHEFY